MSYTKIWIHLVTIPKWHRPVLTKDIRRSLFNHIKENAKIKGIHLDCINGYDNHIHCLIFLKSDQSIGNVVKLIKGESSFWINKNKITTRKFQWAREYFAISVSESIVPRVRDYIKNQENHHTKKPFKEEYDKFVRLYGFEDGPSTIPQF